MEAARVDGRFGAQLLPMLLGVLDRWKEHAPTDPRPGALRGELARMFPDRVEDIGRTQERFSEAEVDIVLLSLEHPAMNALSRTMSRLQTLEELEAGLRSAEGKLAPAQVSAIRQQLIRDSLLGNPDGLRAELARLEQESNGDQAKRPGVLSARALVLGELARLREGTALAVRRATDEAIAALAAVDDPKVRAFIITCLARMWIPTAHAHDPVRDFGYAAELMREGIALQGGEEHALLDSIEFLARAYRYSGSGELAANLLESRRLYRLLLDRARRHGHHDLAANTLHCLAELEDYLGEGDRTERMKRCEQLYLEAISLTPLPAKRAEYRANLALMQTQAAGRMYGPPREDALRRALETFDQVESASLPPGVRPLYASNRVLCETMIAQDQGDPGAALRAWRRHLESLGQEFPVLRASAQHNLALVLIGDDHVTPDELREALRLFELAAATRREEPDVRHRWETMLDIGRAIVRAMDPSDSLPADGLPWAPDEAWAQARRSLAEAASAAEALGPGSELAEAGHWLAMLVGSAASIELALDVADQAWTVLDAATPHLVTSMASREREARVSHHVALGLAHRLASPNPNPNAEPGHVRWALEGDQATPALRWMLRAQQVTRRTVRARLARPRGVSAAAWGEWQGALQGDDPVHRTEVLRRLRQDAPSFLSDDPDLAQTWHWLESRPDALAVATMGSLALAAWVDEGARRRLSLVGLSNEPPPRDPRLLAKEMNDVIEHERTAVPYAELAAWARRVVVEPLTGFIGRSPSTVLWIPDPWLRHVPPSAIWGRVPVATAISADLLDPHVHPGRHPSTLVGLADPGDLGQNGLDAFLTLAEEATRSHPARLLASQGPLHGKALIQGPNVRDTPASIRDLLAESPEHRTIVLIAHGAVDADDPMRADLVCVDAHGKEEDLSVQQLAAHPEAFAGAQVILLSCNSGLMGRYLTEPGGLAGTLISAGARWVVAPLWPITVTTAQDMGRLLLRGLARGDDPWETLARVASEEAEGPDPTTAVQRASFVAWVG